jgi:hypothetical protein
MVFSRLSQLRSAISNLLLAIATSEQDEAELNKGSLVFVLKNFYFMTDNLEKLELQKGLPDVRACQKQLDSTADQYIRLLLKEHFFGVD